MLRHEHGVLNHALVLPCWLTVRVACAGMYGQWRQFTCWLELALTHLVAPWYVSFPRDEVCQMNVRRHKDDGGL
jgi:hypothetical protein